MIADVSLPRIIRIGGGSIAQVPEVVQILPCRKPFIVSDPFMLAHGIVGRLERLLREAGMDPGAFTETVPDPTTDSIEAGVRALRADRYDCIVAIGGGSPIDSAKAIGVLATLGGKMRDYKAPRVTNDASLPVIAIPTTAGTGSECTRYSIITDTELNEKMLCIGRAFLPTAAIVDYELTLSAPPRLTADTGVDALTHAIEAYVSRKANPFSDGLALSAMRTIAQNVRQVYHEPGDRTAREAMMLAATEAGMAFNISSVALVHGMSRPIGAHFHVAHGLSNAMLLPEITAFSVDGTIERYATCARQTGFAGERQDDAPAARRLVDGLANLNRELAVPTPKSYGIDREAYFGSIETMARQALASGSPGNNPRVPTLEEIAALYEKVWS